ncbi:MAG: M20/M25/M40 family metallo-hydrolase [Defluviitaleaceae bacterium]|nr:M20/M25/M40 family metallo-hydrolase [Defluviitaleaceae bacterium]
MKNKNLIPLLLASVFFFIPLVSTNIFATETTKAINQNTLQAGEMFGEFGEIAYRHVVHMQNNFTQRIGFTQRERDTADWIVSELQRIGYSASDITVQPFEVFGQDLEDVTQTVEGHGLEKLPTSQNIIVTIHGRTERTIVVGAHYDSVYTAGTVDNASGTALVLEMAQRLFGTDTHFTIQLVFFGAEEQGFFGSRYFVENLTQAGRDNLLLYVNVDVLFEVDTLFFGTGIHDTETNAPVQNNKTNRIMQLAQSLPLDFVFSPYGIYYTSDNTYFNNNNFPVVVLFADEEPLRPGSQDAAFAVLDAWDELEVSDWLGEAQAAHDTNETERLEQLLQQVRDRDGEGSYALADILASWLAPTNLILHSENDNLPFFQENFPGRVERNLRAYSIFLNEILNTNVHDVSGNWVRNYNGTQLVPLRALKEYLVLSYNITWDGATREITLHIQGREITLQIMNNEVTITRNGTTQIVTLVAPPIIIDNRTYVSLDFFENVLGVQLALDTNGIETALATPVATQNVGVSTLPLEDMVVVLEDSSNISVHSFSLGYLPLETEAFGVLNAPLNGIIALPTVEEPSPLVMFFHGRSDVGLEEDFYSGFDYLVKQLAAEGFVALSISLQAAYHQEVDNTTGETTDIDYEGEIQLTTQLFEEHLRQLVLGNNGEATAHGVNLANRINFDEIHLIGHSRGGGHVAEIAYRQLEQDSFQIASIMLLNPYINEQITTFADVPIGILLSEFDADVNNHLGQTVFDDILNDGTHSSIVSLVYLRGGNHNSTNRSFDDDDRYDIFFTVIQQNEDRWITREQQETFVTKYVVSFLNVVSGASEPWGIFDPSVAQPRSIGSLNMTASTYFAGLTTILSYPFELNTVQSTGNVSATKHVQLPQNYGNPDFFIHPNALRPRSLYFINIAWEGNGEVSFVPAVTDFSENTALSIYLSVDSSSELNQENLDQSFSIILTDTDGNSYTVLIPAGTSTITYHPGTKYELPDFVTDRSVLQAEDIHPWSGYMPLGELRIPLSIFRNVDLTNVAQITLSFDQTESGSVMLKSMFLN